MNKGEKRNFKLLAGMMTGEKKYIDLFDHVDRQTNYDEGKILKTGIGKGQLSVAKNYLYKFLLKSLVYNRPNISSEIGLLKEQVRILVSKKLFSQAGKLLKKTILQAQKLEAWELLLELRGIQAQLLLAKLSDSEASEMLKEIYLERSNLLEKIQQLHELTYVHQQVQLLHSSRLKIRSPKEVEQLSYLKSHPVLKNGEPAGSIRSKLVYLKIKRKLFSYERLPEEAVKYGKRILKVYDSADSFLEMEIGDYFQEVSNLCTYYFRTDKVGEAFQLMDLFLQAKDRFKNCEVEFFQRYYLLQMAYAIYTGNPEHGFSYIDDLQKELEKVRGKIPDSHLQWLFYEVAFLFFLDGQATQASIWLDHFFEIPRSEYLNDLPGFARLLKLLVNFDQGKFGLLENETINTQRYLNRKGNHSGYEYAILSILKNLLKEPGLENNRDLFGRYRMQFIEKMRKEGSQQFDDLLNFELWLRAKEEGVNMALLRRRELTSTS